VACQRTLSGENNEYPDVYIGNAYNTESKDYGIGRISGKQMYKLVSQYTEARCLWQKIAPLNTVFKKLVRGFHDH
jgi:hypothetical protein